ncbi:MFS transporter [Nonomuraea endophytica]|uniref:MFS family permease n=1 Tax=Nonomuraea endophytica TaxID=714136 RepID=A0A7W8AEI7_9ACTN|nr:MFS transporter [Nonomuraea endophytica]MBB5084842.1 MFS family permease [Nonomuraea endophytica]
MSRAYWQLWTSSGLSNLADGILKVALPLVAVQFTRSPTLVAGLAVAVTLPWLVCALPVGALVDRLDRRRAMLAANLARAVLLAAVTAAVLLGWGSIWLLYGAAFLIGTAETVYDTAAQSIVPQIVPRERLTQANGRLYAAELTANQFVGPPLAGLLAAAAAALAFATPAALWLLAVAALFLVRGSYRVERAEPATLRADIAAGLRYLWRQKVLRRLAVLTGLFNFASNATSAVLVLYATGPMNLPEAGYGLLLGTIAAGSLVGSLAGAWLEGRLGRTRTLVVALLAGAVLIGVPAATTSPYLVGAGFFVGGIGIVVANVVMVSLRQRITPDAMLGRVNSSYRLIAWGTMPLGALVGGLLAQQIGLRPLFAVMALVALTGLACVRALDT